MNIHRWLSKSQLYIFSLLALPIATTIYPSHVHVERTAFFAKALSIQISKSSPGRLALAEVQFRDQKRSLATEADSGAAVNLNEILSEKKITPGVAVLRTHKFQLQELTVTKQSAIAWQQNQNFIENLPKPEQERILRSANGRQVVEQDWSVPTTENLLSQKIEELKNEIPLPSHIPAKIQVAATNQDGAWSTSTQEKTSNSEEERKFAKNFTIRGALSIPADGVRTLLLPEHTIEVRWFDEGVAKDLAKVDLSKSQVFQVTVSRLSGYIGARMLNAQNQVVASGQFRLSPTLTNAQLANAEIEIKPRDQVASAYRSIYDIAAGGSQQAKIMSQKSQKANVLVGAFAESLQTTADGDLFVEGLAEGSETLLRTDAKGFYPAIYSAKAGTKELKALFPEKMIQALLSLIRADQPLGEQTGSVIWGTLSSPLGAAGLQVEIEGQPDLKPTYLNELMIPDKQMKSAGRSGYFVFTDLPRGFYSIRATRADHFVSFANVEVDDQTISPVEVAEKLDLQPLDVMVYDGFRGEPQIAQVALQSFEQSVEISGTKQLHAGNFNFSELVHVQPTSEQYLPALYLRSSNQDYLHLPLIRGDWLQGLKAHARLSDMPGTGTLVGFVPVEYEVHFSHAPNLNTQQIVYFNSSGLPVQSPIAGGGFVVFNMDSGSQSALVIPKDASAGVSQLIPVDAGTLSVLKFEL